MSQERVLITGASAGIGAELARCFARDGSDLILVARREDRLQELAEDLQRDREIDILVKPCDLSDAEQRTELFEDLRQSEVAVDVLVNNAGFGVNGQFHHLEMQKQLDLLALNVVALTHLSRLFLPEMVERNCGGILNVASTAAFQAGPRMALYYASKAYVLSMSEAVHEELLGSQVKISCLCPGPTKTEFGEVAGMTDSLLFKFGPMSATSVAKSGYRGFRKNRAIVVPGIGNWMLANGSRMVPRFISRKLAKRLQ